MIELTNITISSSADIIDLRNKLLTLFTELEFTEMKSVSMTTKISDIIHYLYFKQKTLNIKFSIEKTETNYQLVVMTDAKSIPTEMRKNHYLSFSNNKNEIYLSFPLLNQKLKLDEDYIQKLREKIIIKSRNELMREIKQKNIELNKLLEDIKKSSALIQSEKMRALGVLTAGVAHELNNPMMGILNFIQYSIKKTDKDDKRYNALQDAEQETKRCIEIVTNLLTFSHLEKEGSGDFKPVNLAILIKRVIKILSYRLRNEGVTVNDNIPDDLPSVMGHENRLQQVILNLVTNALDAMKNTKTKCLTLNLVLKSDRVKIIISDTGEGMDEETIKKIFEPFFTTKPTGAGTGLGLSVCESIIREHKGNIICHSQKNKGTQFSLSLPLETVALETN